MAGALKVHERGDILFKKGEISDSMYAIISGEMEVVDLTEDDLRNQRHGVRRIISVLKAGDVVGEMGMIRSCERSATVIATRKTELIQINDRMIKRLQWLYPPTAQRFFFNLMTVLCDRLENLTECYLDESITDRRSGLYTRDFFLTALEKEIARSRRHKAPLSLFILNLDNLPDLIVQHGHQEGDRIIAEIGRLIKQHLRKEDFLCRYDYSQFAGMLTHNDADRASAFCNRIKALIARTPFQMDGESIQIITSIGMNSLPVGSDMNMKALVSAALDDLRQTRQAHQVEKGDADGSFS
jgi:hypothetical protein